MSTPATVVKAKRYVLKRVGHFFWTVLDPGQPNMVDTVEVNEFPTDAEKISPLNYSATPYTPYDSNFDYREYRAVLNDIFGTNYQAHEVVEKLTHVGHIGVAVTRTEQETGETYDLS